MRAYTSLAGHILGSHPQITLDSPLSERYEVFSPNGGEPGLEYTQKGH
jgi:hypothetical protein